MSIRWRRRLLAASRAGIFLGLITAPMIASFAEGPNQTSKNGQGEKPAEPPITILHGHVTNEKGEPLADVRVCLTTGPQLAAKSDAHGDYRMETRGITAQKMLYVVASKPGYGRIVGNSTECDGGAWVQVAPGAAFQVNLTLNSALHFAGIVVDEHGKAISDVKISADTTASSGADAVGRTTSDSDGLFELFNYTLRTETIENELSKGRLSFFHPGYVQFTIQAPYRLAQKQRDALRIVLKIGHRVSGTVVDASGKPVPDLAVKAIESTGGRIKAIATDEQGKFVLRGLSDGPTVLTAFNRKTKQNARVPLTLSSDQNDLKIRLKAITLPKDLKRYEVLGMQLTDVTPELGAAYDLPNETGVFILDPGKDSDRLSGPIAEGYVFLAVGGERVGSVRQFLKKILTIAASEKSDEHQIEIWTFDSDRSTSSELKITSADLGPLQRVLDQRTAADQEAILALGKLGAQFRFKPTKPANDQEPNQAGPELSLIILGDKWSGSDRDLRLVSTLPLEGLYVRGRGKVSDQSLEELGRARPDINVDRVSEAFLGAEFVGEKMHQPQVVRALPNSPADRAGFKAKDVLIEFAGKPVPDFFALRAVTFTLKPGQKVAAKLLREGKPLSITVEMSGWD